MTTSACSIIDNLSDDQKAALNALISEKEEIVNFVTYQWWASEIEVLTDLNEPNMIDRLGRHQELISRVNVLTRMIGHIVAFGLDPITEVAIYSVKYSFGDFLEDDYWDTAEYW